MHNDLPADEFGVRASAGGEALGDGDTAVNAGRQKSRYRPESPRVVPQSAPLAEEATTGNGSSQARTSKRDTVTSARSSRSGTSEREAAEGWRGEEVLYQCGAVADL